VPAFGATYTSSALYWGPEHSFAFLTWEEVFHKTEPVSGVFSSPQDSGEQDAKSTWNHLFQSMQFPLEYLSEFS
jgi:hypothetical protein